MQPAHLDRLLQISGTLCAFPPRPCVYRLIRLATMHPSDPQIEEVLLSLIAQRGEHASACPSEIARALSPKDWRPLMPRVRQVAGQLALRGLLDVSQGGQSVPPASLPNGPWKGPIRVRLPRAM